MWVQGEPTALKFDMCFGSSAVEEPVQFQIDESFLKLNLAASRLHEISRLVVYWRGTGSDITNEIQAGVGLPSLKLDSTRWRYGKHEKWYAGVDQFIIIAYQPRTVRDIIESWQILLMYMMRDRMYWSWRHTCIIKYFYCPLSIVNHK